MEEGNNKMRTGRALLMASLPFAKEDLFKSWRHVITAIVLLILAFVGTFNPIHISLQIVFSVLFALMMIRFFIMYHDFNHFAILKNSKLGKILMTWFGIFVLAPITIWKRTHDYHHMNNSKLSNNGVGSYPLLAREDFMKLSKTQKNIYLISRHPITILCGYIALFIFDFNIKTLILNPKKHWDSLIALIFHFGVAYLIVINFGVLALFISWIGPFFLSNAIGSYLFYAQHNFPGAQYVHNKDWDYTDAATKSTSFMKMNSLLNWFTGDIGYHHIHHLNHNIPFYRLREAMDALPEMQTPLVTSFHPKDIYACLQLKVWNHKLKRMEAL